MVASGAIMGLRVRPAPVARPCYHPDLEITVSPTARWLGLAATGLMLLFSTWIYLRTGDWVALVFAVGSFGYGIFFFTVTPRERDS